jgi:hypothetical protein
MVLSGCNSPVNDAKLNAIGIIQRQAVKVRLRKVLPAGASRPKVLYCCLHVDRHNLNLFSTVRMLDFSRPIYRVNQNVVCSPALNA